MKARPHWLIAIACVVVSACAPHESTLQARITDWQSWAAQHLPKGTSREAAQQHAQAKGFQLSHLQVQQQLYAVVETVPESGLNRLVCSEWLVILEANLDKQETITEARIRTAGRCL